MGACAPRPALGGASAPVGHVTPRGPCLLVARSSHSAEERELVADKNDTEVLLQKLPDNKRLPRRSNTQLTKLGSHEPVAGMPDFLPCWAPTEEVTALALTPGFKEHPVPMGLCVGPAVRIARWSVATLWISQCLLALLAYRVSYCQEDGFVYRPSWLWYLFAPVLVLNLGLEYRCLQYTVLPFAQVTGSFRFVGLKVSYVGWLMLVGCLSIVNKVDMASDSFFLAVALRTDQCQGSEVQLDAVWSETIRQSFIPYFSWIRISTITLVCYIVMYMQLLYPLAQSTPTCGDSADLVVGNTANAEFRNILGHNMNLGDVLMILGEAANMASLQAQNPIYARAKEQYKWRHETNPTRSLIFLRNELLRGVVRIGLVALLENAVQLNIQTTLFAMNRAVFGGKYWQTQTLASILLSLMTSGSKVMGFWQCWKFYRSVFRRIELLKEESEDVWTGPSAPDLYRHEELFARRYMILLWGMVVVFFLLCSYACCKLVAAFVCKESVWNLSGCVDLPQSALS